MEISARNLCFSYGDTDVLKNINLDFEKGKFYSILGPNGCGKTTLLDLFIRHLEPQSGIILLKNKNLSDFSRRDIAKNIALVSQDYSINFPFTVKEAVMMGRHPYISRFSNPCTEDTRIVEEVMEVTEIASFKNRKITELSGGERQRCVFARALCQDTPLLLLDEAFSSMDISHSLALLDIVKNEINTKDKIIISVFHDINFASLWSDYLIFMKNGKIAVSGKTADVMTEEILMDVFHVESKVEFNRYAEAKQVYFKTGPHKFDKLS